MAQPTIAQSSLNAMTQGQAFSQTLTATASPPDTETLTVRHDSTDGGFDTQELDLTVEDEVVSGVTWEANLPAGLTEQFDTLFPGPVPSEFGTHPDGWSSAFGFNIATAAAGAEFTGDAASFEYDEGATGGGVGGGGIVYTEGGTHRQAYYCMDLYLSPNYVAHQFEEKFIYPRGTSGGTANQVLTIAAPGDGATTEAKTYPGDFTPSEAELADYVVFASSPQTTGAGRPSQPVTGPFLQKGQWTRIEVYHQMNTAGNADGIRRVWIGGVLAWEQTDIRWREAGAGDGGWAGAYIGSVRGFGDAVNPNPAGMSRQISRLSYHFSTTRSA